MAVDRRLSRRVGPGQQTIFDATGETTPPAGNPWRVTEAHRQAGRAGVAQAKQTLQQRREGSRWKWADGR